MKVIAKRSFEAAPQRLWELIREPGNQPAWNPKCVHCDSIGDIAVGLKFTIVYDFKGRRKNSIGEVLSFEPGRQVTYRYHYQDDAKLGSVDEHFELIPARDGCTTLIHTVDFSNSLLPFWLKWLIAILGRIGKTKGPDPLAGLDDLLR